MIYSAQLINYISLFYSYDLANDKTMEVYRILDDDDFAKKQKRKQRKLKKKAVAASTATATTTTKGSSTSGAMEIENDNDEEGVEGDEKEEGTLFSERI